MRTAFQAGTRWAFISLVPWAGLAFGLALFLANIRDSDREARGRAETDSQAQGVLEKEAEMEVEQEAVGVPSVERAAVSEKEIRMFEAREQGLAGAADRV